MISEIETCMVHRSSAGAQVPQEKNGEQLLAPLCWWQAFCAIAVSSQSSSRQHGIKVPARDKNSNNMAASFFTA